MSVKVHLLYVSLKPAEINSRLAAHEGRLLAILPNYLEVFDTPPKVTDGISQVFAIEVLDTEVQAQVDGPRTKILLWKGNQGARDNSADKLMVPIASLIALGGGTEIREASQEGQADALRAVFGSLPPEGQLAAVIRTVPPETLDGLPGMNPVQRDSLLKWADVKLAAAASASAAGA
jgi:hypothetical protein